MSQSEGHHDRRPAATRVQRGPLLQCARQGLGCTNFHAVNAAAFVAPTSLRLPRPARDLARSWGSCAPRRSRAVSMHSDQPAFRNSVMPRSVARSHLVAGYLLTSSHAKIYFNISSELRTRMRPRATSLNIDGAQGAPAVTNGPTCSRNAETVTSAHTGPGLLRLPHTRYRNASRPVAVQAAYARASKRTHGS